MLLKNIQILNTNNHADEKRNCFSLVLGLSAIRYESQMSTSFHDLNGR